jgi:hypothetical protein
VTINPEKIPYNLSEVILWTLENGNTIRTMEEWRSWARAFTFFIVVNFLVARCH